LVVVAWDGYSKGISSILLVLWSLLANNNVSSRRFRSCMPQPLHECIWLFSLDFYDKKKGACACFPIYARWSYALPL